MNSNFILKRKVDFDGWCVVGRIAKPRERKELDSVLKRAQETNGTTPRDVAEHLFFELSREVVARRLLQIGEALDLLEKAPKNKYVLTDQGKQAIETGKVFVPEHGAWTLWTSYDPLLPSPILRVDEFTDESAVTEVYDKRDENRSFEHLPEYINGALGDVIAPPASSDGITIRIDDLERKVEKAKNPDSELYLHWNVGERQLRLKGTWKVENTEESIDIELQHPDISFDDIWHDLLVGEELSENWDSRQQALEVSFDETNDIERETMSRSLKFRTPSVDGLGEFGTFEVEQVDITPFSQKEAQSWATWRLESRIREFATSKLYGDWWKEASEPFNEFHLECPARSELAADAWDTAGERPDTKIWYLIAAEDWYLK